MRVSVVRLLVPGLLCMGTASVSFAQSQSPDSQAVRAELEQLRQEFDALRRQYSERFEALEARLASLEGGAPSPATAGPPQTAPPTEPVAAIPPGAAGAGGPQGSLPIYGNVNALSKIFNPDIAVIGDFLGAAGPNDVNPTPALEMHEAESSFQAIVDPYARGDFFFAFGSEGVELEEGFITFPTVPGGFLVKVGKTRAAFGRINTFHNHQLPWTDRPLVNVNLLGGEEGISDAGISAARLVPNPWIFLEATGEVYRGESELFTANKRGDLTYVGHVRGYYDISESANVDLGGSYAFGHVPSNVDDVIDRRFVANLWGMDATVRWRPLQRAIYRSFLGRSEVIWRRQDRPGGLQQSVGYYVSGDYQFARRWFGGIRYDRSDRAEDARLHDSGQSLTLTFWPSEFSQIRGQYRRIRYAEESTANELLFQVMFSIGAHGAHPF